MITDKELGELVKAERLKRGWSQEKLVRRMRNAGINWMQSTVTKTESGNRPIRVREVFTLAALLSLDLNAMVVPIEPLCAHCDGKPPAGFTCNDCGVVGKGGAA